MRLSESDRIQVRGIEAYGYVGAFPEERRLGQRFIVDLTLWPGYLQATETDELTHTVHYGVAAELAKKIVEESSRELIEALAADIAAALLEEFPMLLAVDVTVHKPGAPVPLSFADLEVSVRRYREAQVYVGMGSNIGERERYILDAAKALEEDPHISHFRLSSLYESPSWGGVEQGDFLNAVCGFRTSLSPYELLDLLHALEQKAGRERTVFWGPRTLDLDILHYGERLSGTETLRLPHPYILERAFVAQPLKELLEGETGPLRRREGKDTNGRTAE